MTIPAWVLDDPVTYLGFQGAIEVKATLKATSVSATSMTVSDTISTVTTPPITQTLTETFTPGSAAAWGFQSWVDPYDPLGSILGPDGEAYSFQGRCRFDRPRAPMRPGRRAQSRSPPRRRRRVRWRRAAYRFRRPSFSKNTRNAPTTASSAGCRANEFALNGREAEESTRNRRGVQRPA
jgi:hypothetical protein